MEMGSTKDVFWVASSLDDLKEFPESVRQVMGFAIFQAQCGGKHVDAILHAFQKKSKKGIATPRQDIDLIVARLRMAEQIHEARTSRKEGA